MYASKFTLTAALNWVGTLTSQFLGFYSVEHEELLQGQRKRKRSGRPEESYQTWLLILYFFPVC